MDSLKAVEHSLQRGYSFLSRFRCFLFFKTGFLVFIRKFPYIKLCDFGKFRTLHFFQLLMNLFVSSIILALTP